MISKLSDVGSSHALTPKCLRDEKLLKMKLFLLTICAFGLSIFTALSARAADNWFLAVGHGGHRMLSLDSRERIFPT